MKRPWGVISLSGLFALVAYLSLLSGSLTHIADDPGIGWHLKNGELIQQTEEIPRIDPFLARAKRVNAYAPVGEGREWVSDQWLSDLIFYEIFVVGGWPALYALVVGLFLIAYFGIAADGLRRGGQGMILVLLAVVCAFKVGQVHLIVRPVIFSITLFAFVLRRAESIARRETISWRDVIRAGLILAPTFTLWANLHPAFVYGLVLLGVCMLSRLTKDVQSTLKLGALSIICMAATLINPYGIALHRSIAQLGGSSYLRSMTVEWSPVDLLRPEGMYLVALIAIPLCAAVVSRRVRRGVGLFETLVALVFVVQALWAVRVVPFASFACLPLWAACFGSLRLVPALSWTSLSANVLSRVAERESSLLAPGCMGSVCIALVGGALLLVVPQRLLPQEVGSVHERKLRAVFSEIPQRDSSGVILASLNWGGSITHVLGEKFKPVLDDRTVLVGEKLYRAYSESLREMTALQDLVDVFGVTHVILPPLAPIENALRSSSQWKLAYADDGMSVFENR